MHSKTLCIGLISQMYENSNLKEELFSKVLDKFSQPFNYYSNSLLPGIEEYNRADTVNMTPNEMNKFRHITGTAQAINDIGKRRTAIYGMAKEVKDLLQRQGLQDTIYDIKNNIEGYKINSQHPELEGDTLNDYVFNRYIKPYR